WASGWCSAWSEGVDAAIISAASALLGVAVSQGFALLQQRLAARHERAAILRAKLEELADQLHRAAQWADAAIRHWVDRAEVSASPAPHRLSEEARRVYVLALLYFPALRDDARTLLAALDALHALRTLGGDPDTELPRHIEAFSAARRRLDAGIAEEAQRLL
ncbi:MAG: hypothetical protein N2690_01890, partial [Rhodocyclaceae bacterium]|nr:hypothetical protein [Rhodocyclaceae bacterium]